MQFSQDQQKVIDSRGRNLLVSAAAGSGKTAVLVERIISLITDEKDRTDLDRILVVTFTTAAAGEMKERIASALEKRLEADPENEYLRHQAVLIHHAQINTIHSFCSYMIRNYFYRIDMDPVFRVMEEGEQKLLFTDVMSEVLEEKYAGEDPDFEFLVTNWFEGKTDAKLEDTIKDLYETAITTPWPKQWLKQAVLDFEEEGLPREEALQNRYCAPAVRSLASVTETLIDRFGEKKREKGLCDFADLEHLALEILYEENENGEMVRSDAAKELAARFKYVMTDEYQDSNLVQEAILHAVSGNEDGIFNRFMVGDIKQSIYGFRQARPDIFLEKYKSYERGGETCERIDLHTNYRSRREVIDTVNMVFSRLMIPELGGIEYDDAAALRYGGTYPEDGAASPAEFILMDRKSPDMEGSSATAGRIEEARLVAGRIKEIVGRLPVYDRDLDGYRPCRYSDIAVLFRTTSGVADVFASVFLEQGIPSHSVSKEGYFSATEVVTVLNYLSILDNPIQDIPFAAVLFSPIADLSARQLAEIRLEEKEADYYHACLSYVNHGPEGDCKDRLSAFLRQFELLREQSAYTPVYELIENIFKVTGYRNIAAAMPAGEQRAANLDMLVAKAKKFETTSYHGLFNFIRYIERLQKYSLDEGEVNIFSDTADTVRLMSIHKSKGLEFPVVFLCDTSHQFNNRDSSGRFLFHADLRIGLDVCDLEKHRIVKGIRRSRIADRIKEEAYAEQLRVLYVALTRAKEKLFITAAAPDLERSIKDRQELHPDQTEPVPKEIILKGKSFFDWLFLVLYGTEEASVRICVETPTSVGDKLSGHKKEKTGFLERLRDMDRTAVYDEQVHKILEEVRGFSYPYEVAKGMPGKITVTQLKYLNDEMSQEEQGEVFESEPVVVPYLPAFASEKEEGVTGAMRGTIYHKVFEKIEYEKITEDMTADRYVRELLLSLIEKGFLSEAEAKAVNERDIVTFLLSSVGKRMKAADKRGDLKREQAFTFSIPARDALSSWPDDEDLLIQGIIDACFIEDGAYVIVDYKTDHTEGDGASLVDKYERQVYYYAKALEAATGIPVKEKIIYSTFLGRSLAL